LDGSGVAEASLSVLKLSKDRQDPVLIIQSQIGTEIYQCNLIEKILTDNPDNDFDKVHTYYVNISLENEIAVTVTVNGWDNEGENHELEP
jgi:hypothetical protein